MSSSAIKWTRQRPKWHRKSKCLDWIYARIDYDGPSCLFWPYSTDGNGRPQFGLGDFSYKVHRVMCEIENGPAPDGKPEAAHNCGNGHLACCHPKHLEWKSHKDNHADKERHGTNFGNPNGNRTRLAPEAMADIQSRQLSQQQYAEKYGMSVGGVAYWQRTPRGPLPNSTHPERIKRRLARLSAMSGPN